MTLYDQFKQLIFRLYKRPILLSGIIFTLAFFTFYFTGEVAAKDIGRFGLSADEGHLLQSFIAGVGIVLIFLPSSLVISAIHR